MHNKKQYQLEEIINIPNLYNAVDECSQGLMWKESVARSVQFRDIVIYNIMHDFYDTQGYLFDKLYHTIIYERGKERLICSNTIRDRIVGKVFNQNFLLPSFVPSFIYDNSASISNKGIDFELDRVELFLHNAYIEYQGTNFYTLKLDIKKYFDNIYHPYILDNINKYTQDQRIMNYFRNMLYNFQVDSCIHNGENSLNGIGLGGEPSQSFGLICLNEFDHIAKEIFHFKYYVRYMDDILIIFNDKKYLIDFYNYADNHIKLFLHMQLNYNKSNIISISEGVLFLKVHFYVSNTGVIYRKVYKATIKRIKNKMNKFSDMLNEGTIRFTDIRCYYSSVRGSLLRADCYNEISALDQLFNTLYIYNWIDTNEIPVG